AGQGRFVELADDIDVQGAVARVKQRLGVATVRVAAPRGPAARVSRIALCPGAGGELLEPALACGCELFFTGEMRHHDVLAAHERGCAVVLAGHTNTERPFLPVLAARLRGELPGVDVAVATADGERLVKTDPTPKTSVGGGLDFTSTVELVPSNANTPKRSGVPVSVARKNARSSSVRSKPAILPMAPPAGLESPRVTTFDTAGPAGSKRKIAPTLITPSTWATKPTLSAAFTNTGGSK